MSMGANVPRVARIIRNDSVMGSIPIVSTLTTLEKLMLFYFLLFAAGFVVGLLVGRVNPSVASAAAKVANAAKKAGIAAAKKA